MIKKVFSVRDKKAAIYHAPFFANSEIEATRGFYTASQDKQLQLGMFPDEFDLMQLGEWNDETGLFLNFQDAKYVISASVCQKMAKEKPVDRLEEEVNKNIGVKNE